MKRQGQKIKFQLKSPIIQKGWSPVSPNFLSPPLSSLNVVFINPPHTSLGDKNFSIKHEFTMGREIMRLGYTVYLHLKYGLTVILTIFTVIMHFLLLQNESKHFSPSRFATFSPLKLKLEVHFKKLKTKYPTSYLLKLYLFII